MRRHRRGPAGCGRRVCPRRLRRWPRVIREGLMSALIELGLATVGPAPDRLSEVRRWYDCLGATAPCCAARLPRELRPAEPPPP